MAVPFLLLFVVGYWWAGFTTLYQEYQGKLQWQRERALALELRDRCLVHHGEPESFQSKVRCAGVVHEHFHRVE